MALWSRKPRKRKSEPTGESPSNTNPLKQRKSFPAEVKLPAVKTLEAGSRNVVEEFDQFNVRSDRYRDFCQICKYITKSLR